MANASSTTQKIKTYMKNELNVDFDIDASTTCKMASDTGQLMKNIQITGGKNITLSQLSKLQNLCYAQQVLNSEQFNQLSAKAQDDIANTAKQEGGLSVNVNNTTQDIEKKVENKFDLKTKLNMRKDCFNKVKAPQSMTNIAIQDSLNIDLTQQSDIYNKCMFDSATALGIKQATDAEAGTKAASVVTQKGFDPLGALTSLLGLGASGMVVSMVAPLIICIISIGLSVAMGGKGGQQPDDSVEMENMAGNNTGNGSGFSDDYTGYEPFANTNQGGSKGGSPFKRWKKWLKWIVVIVVAIAIFYLIKYLFIDEDENENKDENKEEKHNKKESFHVVHNNYKNNCNNNTKNNCWNNRRYEPNYPSNELPHYLSRNCF